MPLKALPCSSLDTNVQNGSSSGGRNLSPGCILGEAVGTISAWGWGQCMASGVCVVLGTRPPLCSSAATSAMIHLVFFSAPVLTCVVADPRRVSQGCWAHRGVEAHF